MVIACGGGEQVSSNGDKVTSVADQRTPADNSAGKSAPTAGKVPIPAPAPTCDELGAAVTAAAGAVLSCERDDDCAVAHVSICEVEGVGCYQAFVSNSQPRAPFDNAITRYFDQCGSPKCDCKEQAEASSCASGKCVAALEIIAPPAATIARRPTMKALEKNQWVAFGGTYFRMWGNAFTGSQPKGVSVTPDGSKVFVTNTGYHNHKNVTRFDPSNLKTVVEASFKGNAIESMVSPAGDVLWVSNFYHHEVLELDTDTLKVKRRFEVGNMPKHFAVSPDREKLWVANWASDDLSVVDLESGKSEATIDLENQPRGTTITNDGKKVYVTNFGSKSISVIDTATRKVTKTIEAKCRAPRHATTTADDRILVSCYGGSEVLVIDSAKDEIIRRVTVGNGPKTVSISHDQRFAYTADYRGATMSIIDMDSWEVLILPIPTVKTSGLHVGHDDRRIYLTGWSARNLIVMERLLPGDTPTDLGPQGFGAVCRQSPKSDCKKYP